MTVRNGGEVAQVNTSTPFHGVIYSQSWEDPESGRAALRITPDDDVLAITSGGCNVLALALEGPRSITAVDVNPAQNNLLQLKMAALRTLEHEQLLRFVGVLPSRERLCVYSTFADQLPPAARAYWDARPAQLAGGLLHSGRFERYLGLFRRVILPLTHSRHEVERLLSLPNLSEQRRFYTDVWNNRRWRLLFRAFFGRLLQGRLGRHPDHFRYVDVDDFGGHYLERARHGLVEVPVLGNYFLEFIATGGYRNREALPPYLAAGNLPLLRQWAGKIQVASDELLSFLRRQAPGAFSCFHLSDIFEYMSADTAADVFHELVRVARRRARLCYYNNLIYRSHPDSLAGKIVPDEELGRRLHWRDRAFFYGRFAVATVV